MEVIKKIINITGRFFAILSLAIIFHYYLRPIFENPESASLTGTRQLVLIIGHSLSKSNSLWVIYCIFLLSSIYVLTKDYKKNQYKLNEEKESNALAVYIDFISLSENFGIKFKSPIVLNENICSSSELRKFLSIKNGQREDSDYVFRWISSGKFKHYKFLNWSEIVKINNEICSNQFLNKQIDKELLHFAVCPSNDKYFKYSNSFALSKSNEVFKCDFKENNSFKIMNEIGQVRISSSLNEFIELQLKLMSWDYQENYKIK